MNRLWRGKCPRCGEGAVFKQPLLSIHFADMHDSCPQCQATFQPEPGFYFGAMFVSYAITVALMVATSMVLWLFFDVSTNVYIASFIIVTLLFSPLSYRWSRLLWLYWFGGHTRIPKP